MEKYIVDIILLLIVFAFTVTYSVRGFAKTILRFVSFIAAIVLSKAFAAPVTDWVLSNTKFLSGMEKHLAEMVIIVLLFLLISIVLKWITSVINKLFKIPVLKQANKVLGGIFGAVNGLIVVIILSVCLQISSHMVYNARYLNAVRNSVIVQTVLPDENISGGIALTNGGK